MTIQQRRPFAIRPVSKEGWNLSDGTDRRGTHKTAYANYLYIKRLDGSDILGRLPRFSERNDLVEEGLAVPDSAPEWALESGVIWREIDDRFQNERPDRISAWHIVLTLPLSMQPFGWRDLLNIFCKRNFTSSGMIADWAIHAQSASGGRWLTPPHAHILVTAVRWSHDRLFCLAHPFWCQAYTRRKLERDWLLLSGL